MKPRSPDAPKIVGIAAGISAACKKARHCKCFALACSCFCHHKVAGPKNEKPKPGRKPL